MKGLLETIPRELPPKYDPTALRATVLGLEAAPIKAPGEDSGTKLAIGNNEDSMESD